MSQACISCRSPQSDSKCGLCEGPLCRKCRIFLSEDEFPYVTDRPAELQHTYYCGPCFDLKVEPFKTEYEDALARSQDINIFYKGSKSSIRVIRKASKVAEVSDVADKDEAILRLAFLAAREGYNAVIDVEVSSEKQRNAGWQKSAWSGRGTPAQVTSHELGLK